jgi:hypothetical protein
MKPLNSFLKSILTIAGLLALLFQGSIVLAQEYPVQVTTIVTPPYSLYLSDYASPEGNAMQVIIQLRELDRPEYRVKLRLTIEGQGITLRTKSSYIPRALVLQGGVPEILTGPDLSAYLNPDNLDFSGISRQEFLKNGTFPEGFYTFKIEVVDYLREVVVSNPGFANAWIILNDPPLVNLPFNDEKVNATDPQNVMFSWTPRHAASPNAAFSTEYEFTLVELYPANRNPNDAIRAANSIFVTQTTSTSLNYGIMEPLLIPGRKYAFRIRAYDVNGRDLFKNNGYSEVHVFQFGDACIPPPGIKADALDAVRMKLSWDQIDLHTGYGIKYRKKGSGSWQEENVFANSSIVPGLQAGATYEYQVKGVCGSIQGDFSPIATITTPEVTEDEFSCGAPASPIDLKTTPLKDKLQVGDIIKSGDFEIRLSEVTANADGSYKGAGLAMVPWFKFASARVKFAKIQVNEEYRVFNGNITTSYNPNSQFVARLDRAKDEMNEEKTDSTANSSEGNDDNFNGIDTTFSKDIDSVIVNPNGDLLIVNTDGTTTTLPRAENAETRVTDSNGDTWTVDKDGNVTGGNEAVTAGGGVGPGVGVSAGITVDKDGQINFEPFGVTVQLAETESLGEDENGNCHHRVEGVTIKLVFNQGSSVSETFYVDGITLEFYRNCTTGEIVRAVFSYDGRYTKNIQIGKISLDIASIDLDMSADGHFSGSILFKVLTTSDIALTPNLILKEGMDGTLKFAYDNSDRNYVGKFGYSEVKNLKVALVSNGKEIALFTKFDGVDDRLAGKFEQLVPVTFTYNEAQVTLSNVYIEGSIDLFFDDHIIDKGSVALKVENLQGFPGTFEGTLNYDNATETFTSGISGQNFSAFDMQFSSVNLTAVLSKDLEFKSISGSFDVTHPDFTNSRLTAQHFLIEGGELKEFNITGQVDYLGATYELQRSEYKNGIIFADVKIKNEDTEAGLQMAFHPDGTIEILKATLALPPMQFGPIVAEVVGTIMPSSQSNLNDGFTRFEDLTVKFSVEIPQQGGSPKVVQIAQANATFELNLETKKTRNVALDMQVDGTYELFEFSGVKGQFKGLDIKVNGEGELSGHLDFGVLVEEPITIDLQETIPLELKNKFRINSASGELRYVFSGKTTFEGKVEFWELKDINLELLKKTGDGLDESIITMRDGIINESVLRGTFELSKPGGVSYKAKGFTTTLKELSVTAEIRNLSLGNTGSGSPELKFISGSGAVEVSDIKGMKGTVAGSLEVGEDIRFKIEASTDFSAYGFTFSQLNVSGALTTKLDLMELKGTMKAKHTDFEANLDVTSFHFGDGSLQAFQLRGNTKFKGVEIYISNGNYSKATQLFALSAGMKFPTGAGQSSEIVMKNFVIDSEGEIREIELSGDLHIEPMELTFNGRYSESRFSLGFDAKLYEFKLKGLVDLGAIERSNHTYYNYFYLKASAESYSPGLPLGPTGLTLTKMGGEFGYNYAVDFLQQTKSPAYNSYTAGVELGISAAKIVGLQGRANATISPNLFQFNLGATLTVPASTDPYIQADGQITYQIKKTPQGRNQSIYGKLNTKVNIPKSTGSIFNMNAGIDFKIDQGLWKVETAQEISGKIFNKVNYTGDIDLGGSFEKPDEFAGQLNGRLNYEWSVDYKETFLKGIVLVEAGVVADVEAFANLSIQPDNVSGEACGCAIGTAQAKISNPLTGYSYQAALKLGGAASIVSNGNTRKLDFKGKIYIEQNGTVKYDFNQGGMFDFNSLTGDFVEYDDVQICSGKLDECLNKLK